MFVWCLLLGYYIYVDMTGDKTNNESVVGVVSSILGILTLPVVAAAFLNVVKSIVTYMVPKDMIMPKIGYRKGTMRFPNDKRDHLDVQRYPEELPVNNVLTGVIFPVIEWLVDKADKLATKYIDLMVRLLKVVPKFRKMSDSDLRHVAVTVYYTVSVGLIMKVVKLLMIKKGMSGDTAAFKSIRDMITNGLKLGSYDLDFDDIEKESDVIFSNKSFAPLAKEFTDRIGSVTQIMESIEHDTMNYKDFYTDSK